MRSYTWLQPSSNDIVITTIVLRNKYNINTLKDLRCAKKGVLFLVMISAALKDSPQRFREIHLLNFAAI